jgi:hypothetical protein
MWFTIALRALGKIPFSWYLFGALALTALYAKHLRSEVAEAEALAQAKQLEVDTAISANASNIEAIAVIKRNLDTCVGQAQLVQDLADEAKRNLAATRAERKKLESERRADLEKLYASDPECAEWARQPVCTGVSDRLH